MWRWLGLYESLNTICPPLSNNRIRRDGNLFVWNNAKVNITVAALLHWLAWQHSRTEAGLKGNRCVYTLLLNLHPFLPNILPEISNRVIYRLVDHQSAFEAWDEVYVLCTLTHSMFETRYVGLTLFSAVQLLLRLSWRTDYLVKGESTQGLRRRLPFFGKTSTSRAEVGRKHTSQLVSPYSLSRTLCDSLVFTFH